MIVYLADLDKFMKCKWLCFQNPCVYSPMLFFFRTFHIAFTILRNYMIGAGDPTSWKDVWLISCNQAGLVGQSTILKNNWMMFFVFSSCKQPTVRGPFRRWALQTRKGLASSARWARISRSATFAGKSAVGCDVTIGARADDIFPQSSGAIS